MKALRVLVLCCLAVPGWTEEDWQCQQGVNCHLPDCRCSSDRSYLGTRHVPQIVHFGFDDALNEVVAGYYRRLFRPGRRNPNGCPVTMTLFVQHAYTNYKLVHEFYKRGMEIAVHGVAHTPITSHQTLRMEATSQRENIAVLGQVPRKEIVGWRSPNLQTVGDTQPKLLQELGYMYDFSLPFTRRHQGARTPFPYTLDYGYPYSCTVGPCPGRRTRHPGFWEVPINSWIDHHGAYPCSYVDGCVNRPQTEEEAFRYLWQNFADYYNGSRAPFGINMHASWFLEPRNFRAMERFLTALSRLKDVYVLSVRQMLDWVRQPLSLGNIWKLASWSCPDPWGDRSLSLPTLRPSPVMTTTEAPHRTTTTRPHRHTTTRNGLSHPRRAFDDHVAETTTPVFETPSHKWFWERVKEFYRSGALRRMASQRQVATSTSGGHRGRHRLLGRKPERQLREEALKDNLEKKTAETDKGEDKSLSTRRRGHARTTQRDRKARHWITDSDRVGEQTTRPAPRWATQSSVTSARTTKVLRKTSRRTRFHTRTRKTRTRTARTTTPVPVVRSTSITTRAKQASSDMVKSAAAAAAVSRVIHQETTSSHVAWYSDTTKSPATTTTTTPRPAESGATVEKRPFSVWPPTQVDCWQESNCQAPDCYCRSTNVPGGLWPRDTPQMVYVTFDGAVDQRVFSYFSSFFDRSRRNADSCPIKATFFVDRTRSSYRLVQQLEKSGMEISLKGVDYHSDWRRMNIARYMRVQLDQVARSMPDLTMLGWRSSDVQPLGDTMFQSLKDRGFLYDSSLVYPVEGNWNVYLPWPYTLDFGWRESCTVEGCPVEKHPGLWEIPMVPLLDPQDEFQCLFADGCTNRPQTEQETYDFLMKNFQRHYRSNRTPFGVHLRSQWFWHHLYAPNRRGFDRFIRELVDKNDVYIVSMKQIIDWMTNPTPLSQMERFGPWTC